MAFSSPLPSRWPRHMAPKLLVLALAAVAGVAAGLLSSPLDFHDASATKIAQLPVAYAANCGQNPGCGGVATSAIDVDHRVYPGGLTDDPEQLNNSEQWTITAYWDTLATAPGCACGYENNSYVTVAMSHSGTSWTATCTGCDATNGPIYSVTACDINADDCSSYDGDYRLIVRVKEVNGLAAAPCNGNYRYINRVAYSVTAIDDGNSFETTHCTLGGSVSPTQITFAATDNGAFACANNCSQVGTNLVVTFQ